MERRGFFRTIFGGVTSVALLLKGFGGKTIPSTGVPLNLEGLLPAATQNAFTQGVGLSDGILNFVGYWEPLHQSEYVVPFQGTVGPLVTINGSAYSVAQREVKPGDKFDVVCEENRVPVRISVNGD